MVNRVAMLYGQVPHVVDALPAWEKNEMTAAIQDLAEYEAEAWQKKPDEGE